ncbi:hypothetical protein [Micromonospora sp. NBC_00617]|uniref:hypothetical protein n=1 Tax=Micromonospora sp. NBC_00617 TaxID=2903587 RepID=UPI0030E45E17
MTTEAVSTDWWVAEDVADVAEWLASRRHSRLWNLVAPEEIAAWAFAEPEPTPLDPAPAAFDGYWRDGLNEQQQAAWALAGWFIRMTVPEAARTAGEHWLLLRHAGRDPFLRLTVGGLETLRIYEAGNGVVLRIASVPVGLALEAGAVRLETWAERGVEANEDALKTLAEAKFVLDCPDIATATWLLSQPSVIAAARMLNAWVSAGSFPFARDYQPEAVARAWLAAESLLDVDAFPADSEDQGFDRPYTTSTVSADLPAQRSFDADAYRAGVSEHDRLCLALIDHLAGLGVRVGAGLHGVPVDLAWRDADGRQFIAEVKSVVGDNEVEQLRLGLGQVLEYRHRLAAHGIDATPVLVVSRCTDRAWPAICGDNHVILLHGQGTSDWTAAPTKGRQPDAYGECQFGEGTRRDH